MKVHAIDCDMDEDCTCQTEMDLNGPTLLHHDFARVARQRGDVWQVMAIGGWWTLASLARCVEHPEASVSARLRDFRKVQFGSHTVDRRRRYGEERGTWEYRLTPNPDGVAKVLGKGRS